MANRKISEFTALTQPAPADVLPIVDVSEALDADKNKKITVEEIFKSIPSGTAASPGIAFESDDGNGIYFASPDTIGISTNGTSRLTISSGGTVAIAGGLTTGGTIVTTGSESAAAFIPTGSGVPTNGLYLPSANNVAISTNGTQRLLIDAAGQIEAASLGTAAAPAWSYVGDPNTGIYSPGADQLAISTGGTGRLFVDSAGNVGVGTTSPNQPLEVNGTIRGGSYQFSDSGTSVASYIGFSNSNGPTAEFWGSASANSGSLLIKTAGTERARIDSSGRLLVGTSSARSTFYGSTGTCELQLEGDGEFSAVRNINDAFGSSVILGKTRSSTNTVVSSGDALGNLSYQGNDGSKFVEAARIAAVIDGTPGNDDMPGRLVFSTTADGASSPTERARIDSSGNVGIGTTSPAGKFVVRVSDATGDETAWNNNYFLVSGGDGATAHALALGVNTSGNYSSITSLAAGLAWKSLKYKAIDHIFEGAASVERARIDSSGRLLVGASSARSNFFNTSWTPRLQIEGTSDTTSAQALICNSSDIYSSSIQFAKSRGATIGSNTVVQANDYLGSIGFQGSDGTEFVSGASIEAFVDGTPGANDMPTRLMFSTTADGASSPTERMRITSGGSVQCNSATGSTPTLGIENSSNASGSQVLFLGNRANANDTSSYYIIAQEPGVANRFFVYGNGNVANANNSYGAISDVKLKENIINASSQWSDLKALRVRKYNFKPETGQQTHTQIGLVAQEVEVVSPGLIYESPDLDAEGNDLGTVTKSVNYSVLYMKAVKALQEAMERIETLEAKVAALEAA